MELQTNNRSIILLFVSVGYLLSDVSDLCSMFARLDDVRTLVRTVKTPENHQ